MKNIYEIQNRAGVTLCYQTAHNADEAIEFARMYGVRGACRAVFVSEAR